MLADVSVSGICKIILFQVFVLVYWFLCIDLVYFTLLNSLTSSNYSVGILIFKISWNFLCR